MRFSLCTVRGEEGIPQYPETNPLKQTKDQLQEVHSRPCTANVHTQDLA